MIQNKKMSLNELRRKYYQFNDQDLWCLCDSLFIYTDSSFMRCFDSFKYSRTTGGEYEITTHTQKSALETIIKNCGYRNKKRKQRK